MAKELAKREGRERLEGRRDSLGAESMQDEGEEEEEEEEDSLREIKPG